MEVLTINNLTESEVHVRHIRIDTKVVNFSKGDNIVSVNIAASITRYNMFYLRSSKHPLRRPTTILVPFGSDKIRPP